MVSSILSTCSSRSAARLSNSAQSYRRGLRCRRELVSRPGQWFWTSERPQATRASTLEVVETAKESKAEEPEAEEFEDDGTEDDLGLSTQQVHSMLHVLCNETEIAEMELKMGAFQLKVRRSAKNGVAGAAGNGVAGLNGSGLAFPVPPPGTAFASTASMDLPSGEFATHMQQSLDEDPEDEGTLFLTAPKVGVMRRGRYVKGKRVGKGLMVQEGDQVKRGQTLGFIEQLGTFVPVEAPQAGEIVSFVVEEGAAVEFNQSIIELAPFFGGHIIGDSKNA